MQILDRTGVGTLWSICKTKFALKDHSHNYLPLSGGTLTGDLLFSNSGTTFRQIRGTCGDNDFWRIGGGATGNNAGYMEIATADDGTEPIYVRQYSGTFSTITRTATLLDGSGNTSFPGTVAAAKFKGALEGNASTASNASTVNGHTVNTNVPSNAKFTDTEYVIPTLSSAPTSSTLTFTDNGVTRSFKVGYMCRVADSSAEHGYKFYQLYDISDNNAIWGEISGGGGDYDETVTVILTSSISSSDSKLNGAVVTVNNTMTNEIQTQTWNGTPLVFKVPATNVYVISVSNVSGYILPKNNQYTAGVSTNRDVTISYKHIPLGIYIYDTDCNFTKANKWNTANNKKAVGVSVHTENSQFIIGADSSYIHIWSEMYSTPSGVVITTNATKAKKDYAGKTNTDNIIKELGKDAEAATSCRNYKFKNGKTGYLWSLGEMVDAINNKQAIDDAIEKIGGTSLSDTNDRSYWTSTMYNGSYVWTGSWHSDVDVFEKSIGYTASVRPVCQF